MNQFEAYSLLFTDSLVSNLVISVDSEIIIYSMKMFGTYNNWLMLIVATSAFLTATSINYLFGRILLRIFYFSNGEQNHLRHERFTRGYLKYSTIIIGLTVIPFWGRFVPLSAGFIKINYAKVIAVSGLMKLCYYIYVLY